MVLAAVVLVAPTAKEVRTRHSVMRWRQAEFDFSRIFLTSTLHFLCLGQQAMYFGQKDCCGCETTVGRGESRLTPPEE